MNFITKIKNMPKNMKILVAAGGVLVFILVLFMVFNVTGKEDPVTYEYDSAIERKLADEVKAYLGEYLILEEHDSNIIANEAVLGYRTIMESGIQSITDEHSDALNQKMRKALDEYTADEQITYDDLEALASGISKIILDTILQQLEQSTMASMESYKEEYQALVDSLQMQIDALNKKSTTVNITAHIKKNENEEKLLAELSDAKEEINQNVNKELSEMKEKIENVKDGEDGSDGKTTYFAYAEDTNGKGFSLYPTEKSKYIGTCISAESVQPTSASAYSNWTLFVGKDGATGKTGEKGSAGEDGKTTYFAYAEDASGKGFSLRPTSKTKYMGTCITSEPKQPTSASAYSNWQIIVGQDGEAGKDGKTTYIAYADDKFGTHFSLTPTETSKYIGTCITSETNQPTDASYYGNWQLYRNYIITSVTDQNNNTTLYIQ